MVKNIDLRSYVKQVTDTVATKANLIDAYFVICFWKSPINNDVEYRSAYFDSFMEATMFQTQMIQTYRKYNFYVTTNLSSVDTDGGLLYNDATI